jgi:hypothetical protein
MDIDNEDEHPDLCRVFDLDDNPHAICICCQCEFFVSFTKAACSETIIRYLARMLFVQAETPMGLDGR